MQELIVGILFSGALLYMARLVWRQYKTDDSCTPGCHSCGISQDKKPEKLPASGKP